MGCPTEPPPFVPLDTAPFDGGRDAPPLEDSGIDATVEDTGMDAPVIDTGVDAPVDTGVDAPVDAFVPPDTACVMRADCDSNGSCETALGTLTNCRACGEACPTAPPNTVATCDATDGCTSACRAGFEDCDGVAGNGCEVNTSTSAANCGGCGMACDAPSMTTVSCAGGDCVYVCPTGRGDCDDDLGLPSSNGCEISTATSLTHCGMCGRACTLSATAVNATPRCASSACTFTCDAGFGDCDSNLANACETDTRTTTAHCGMCGRVCTLPLTAVNASPVCGAGACSFVCDAGFSNCDGNAANGCERTGATCT